MHSGVAFPARAGMNRVIGRGQRMLDSVPRTCGDEPCTTISKTPSA
jgi:hypothetical protein